MNPVHPQGCGAMAVEALASAQSARLMGVTSRGVFLGLDTGWVVFCSSEAYRGPLTINLGREMGRLAVLEPGAAVYLRPGRLIFPSLSLALVWADAPCWEPVAPLEAAGAFTLSEAVEGRRQRGQALACQVQAYQRASPVIDLLPAAWGMEPALGANPALLEGFIQARRAWQAGDPAGLADALAAFIGLGSGLTPSGDDLILGFLLALNRWGSALEALWSPDLRQAVSVDLVARVRRGSSALCASLAACAARGQADERLILALDGLAAGPVDSAIAQALAGWGSSSGFDALVGMGLVFGSIG